MRREDEREREREREREKEKDTPRICILITNANVHIFPIEFDNPGCLIHVQSRWFVRRNELLAVSYPRKWNPRKTLIWLSIN